MIECYKGKENQVREGWMKVNTNVMFMDGCIILAMVMCNSVGHIEFCDTTKASTRSTFIIELLAIDWANDLLCKLSCFSI